MKVLTVKYLITIAVLILLNQFAVAGSLSVSEPHLVGDQFGFAEGPVWDVRNQQFLFTDIPNQTIYSVTTDGSKKVVDKESGFANGLAIDSAGNIWSARHDRKLSFTQPDGNKIIAAATYSGKPLNSPNDLIIDGQGAIWFTDPPFGIQGYGPQKASEEQAVRGVYRYKDGALTQEYGGLTLPNGLAFSPKGDFLYVADTADGWVYRFNVKDDHINNPIQFVKVDVKGADPIADGVEVDSIGNIYVAGPGGVGIFNPEGEQMNYIKIDSGHISNVALGGDKQQYMLVTAYNKVLIYQIH